MNSVSIEIQNKVTKLVSVLRDKGLTLGFAESCTGGLLSSFLTEQAGVSDVFMGSVVCYENRIKENILGVSRESLNTHGAVSKTVALEMSAGVLKKIQSHLAVGITGIAGPTGGTDLKPVGTVFISVGGFERAEVFAHHFFGDRKSVQLQSVKAALEHLEKFVSN